MDRRVEDRGNENSCERPGKRRKLRERIKDVDVMWGQTQIVESEESNGILKWLYEVPDEPVSDASKKETMRQKKLEPWTWVRIAAWDTLIEIARNIEKDKVTEEQEAEKQVARIGEEFKERKTLIGEERLGKTAEEVSSPQTAAKKPLKKKKKPQDLKKSTSQDIRNMILRNKEAAKAVLHSNKLKRAEKFEDEQVKSKTEYDDDKLLYSHLEFWEKENFRLEAEGRELEWEDPPWRLTEGRECENPLKRKRGKKIRWTSQATTKASLKGEKDDPKDQSSIQTVPLGHNKKVE